MPHLKSLLEKGQVTENDPVEKAMLRFRRKGRQFKVISMSTPLEELEGFFEGHEGEKQEFAVVTDEGRRWVMGVATRGDLEDFVKRRP
jgi:hypothetical protein